MPDRPVHVGLAGADPTGPGLLLTPAEPTDAPVPKTPAAATFDRLTYGSATTTPFDATTPPQVTAEQVIDSRLRAFDGAVSFGYTINGQTHPNAPTIHVHPGDLVRVRIVNRSMMEHPMHLHGHRVLIISRNGTPVTGSPWWTDTVPVAPGETYDIVFRADNPGIWMNHCHQLNHAAAGMSAHLQYTKVTTPYQAGHTTGNHLP